LHLGELQHGPREQTRAGEEHDRHRDLRDNKPALQSLASQAPARPAPTSGDHCGERTLPRQRCHEREHQGQCHRNCEGEAESNRIEADLPRASRIPVDEGDEQADAADRDDHAKNTTHQRQQQVLDQQHSAQPRRPGAKRRPCHEFRLPSHATHQREVCDVGGRDDHDEGRRAHQQPEGQLGARPKRLLEGYHADSVVRSGVVGVLELARYAGVDGAHFGPCLFQRRARFQPRDHFGHAMRTPCTIMALTW
jgi:hypothetical protein